MSDPPPSSCCMSGSSKVQPKEEDTKPKEPKEGWKWRVPSEDLTKHNFGTRDDDLTDRELFAWAYQTETKVRFEKLESRDDPNSSSKSTTLVSDYLIDAYPTNGDEPTKFKSVFERDFYAYRRKAISSLQQTKQPDGSMLPIEIRGYDRNKDHLVSNVAHLPIPPNYLFFEICLEAYCGYSLRGLYNSNKKTMPRGAMMGGAIVAALTAWRDNSIVQTFQKSSIESILLEHSEPVILTEDAKKVLQAGVIKLFGMLRNVLLRRATVYKVVKRKLLNDINVYFSTSGVKSSPFFNGDVDMFLQASPVTRFAHSAAYSYQGVGHDGESNIGSVLENSLGLRGLGWCHADLERFSKAVLGKAAPAYTSGHGYEPEFILSLSKNGLSFSYAPTRKHDIDDDEHQLRTMTWPRNTQLIMLDPRADLLGALMDFDLSLACCAYDGVSVRMAPRAALSLQRLVLVITPFCFEEKRNRQRVFKYFRRGFEPFLLDPGCVHEFPCKTISSVVEYSNETVNAVGGGSDHTHRILPTGRWKGRHLRSGEEYTNLTDHVYYHGGVLCCSPHIGDSCNRFEYLRALKKKQIGEEIALTSIDRSWNMNRYAFALFEETEGDATDYYADMLGWDEAKRQEVESIPNYRRYACSACRLEYACYLAVKNNTLFETTDDTSREVGPYLLTANPSTGGWGAYLSWADYGGLAFDSTKVRNDVRSCYEVYGTLISQSRTERIRYRVKHGTYKGYKPRYLCASVRADDWTLRIPAIKDPKVPIEQVLQDKMNWFWDSMGQFRILFAVASLVSLRPPVRSPVGLNPERFIGRCKTCKAWLHGCEYGTQYCHDCSNKKPAAK